MTSNDTPTDSAAAVATGQSCCDDSDFLESAIVRVSDILAGCWDDKVDEPLPPVRGRCIVHPGDTPEQTVARMDASLRADPRWAKRRRI